MQWKAFKICGPREIPSGGRAWCILAQRSDGAVFWQNLSVYSQHTTDRNDVDAFWMRTAQAFQHLDNLLTANAPRSAYVDFSNARMVDGVFV